MDAGDSAGSSCTFKFSSYMLSRITLCLFIMMVCGCGPSGPSAKQIADEKARQSFRETVAAMKVCTQGATYKEFREKRLALETSYTANRSAITNQSSQIDQLLQAMKATETLWKWEVKFPLMGLPSRTVSGWTEEGWPLAPWDAMLVINPAVAAKAGATPQQADKDPDFYAKNYVRRGLALISKQCDDLLK
jgi:hypothetical protein